MEIGQLDKIKNDEINEEIEFKSSEVRGERILFDLGKKAKVISDSLKLIDEVENTGVSFKAISDFLNDLYQEKPEIYKKLLEYYALVREYKQIKEKSKLDLVLEEKVQSMRKKLNMFQSDDNLEFFRVLPRGIDVLKNKYDLIKRTGKRDEIIENLLEKTLFPKGENRLDRKSIKDIKVSAFSIDVIVEKDYVEILYKTLVPMGEDKEDNKDKNNKKKTISPKAFHHIGSPFNIYKEGEENIKKIRKHENIHNILEGFFPPLVAYPSSLIEDKFSLLDKQGGAEKIKQAILSFSPSKCVDLLHQEMFANIEIIEDLLSDPSNSFINNERRKGFGPAGSQISRITDFLSERINEENNEEIRKFCAEFSGKIDEKFDKTASIMRRVLFIGNELKQEFMVHSLLAMMKPTKFHHIETYLKSQCGKELYEKYALMYDQLFEKTTTS